MTRRSLSLLFMMLGSLLFGQLDLEHWFPPYYRPSGNNGLSEVLIYISTDKEQAFRVNIYQHGELLRSVEVSKNHPATYRINKRSDIETSVVGRTMKAQAMGFHLTGAQSFYASLRLADKSGSRSEVIASKGKYALGKEFYCVMDPVLLYTDDETQRAKMNYQISVMATQDNTHVQISGYDEGIRFADGTVSKTLSFTLNKDESYIVLILKAENPFPTSPPVILDDHDPNPVGARIVADKPVVVNNGNYFSQDIGEKNGSIHMDQTVPTDKTGKEFFVVNGMTKTEAAMERVLIVATQDHTSVYFNNETQPFTTLNKGEYYNGPPPKYSKFYDTGTSFTNDMPVTVPSRGMTIRTSSPVYLYQLIGGYNDLVRGPRDDYTTMTGAMTFSYPLDRNYYPNPAQQLDNMIIIPEADRLGERQAEAKLTVKTLLDAKVLVDGHPVSLSPVLGIDGWAYYTIAPVSGNLTVQSDRSLNVDWVGGFPYSGFAASYTGYSSDPYIIVNGNCIQEDIFLTLNNTDFTGFQWLLDDVEIKGAVASSYQPTQPGDYSCRVSYLGFDFTTSKVHVSDCPYKVIDVDIGAQCSPFLTEISFNEQGHVFSALEILTPPQHGTAAVQDKQYISVTANGGYSGEDRLVCKLAATDGYYEVKKLNFQFLPSPVANVLQEIYSEENTNIYNLDEAIMEENGETFAFYPGKTDAENQQNQIFSTTSYESDAAEVYVRVTNAEGCFIVLKINLVKEITEPVQEVLPNVFSPNHDGYNDIWDYSILKQYAGLKLIIFDRYGNNVYQHSDSSYAWDGRSRGGKLMSTGTYWAWYSYIVSGKVVEKSQWILLKNR